MLKIEITTANAAFSDDPAREVASILSEIAQKIERAGGRSYDAPIYDLNGNRVGRVEFDADAD